MEDGSSKKFFQLKSFISEIFILLYFCWSPKIFRPKLREAFCSNYYLNILLAIFKPLHISIRWISTYSIYYSSAFPLIYININQEVMNNAKYIFTFKYCSAFYAKNFKSPDLLQYILQTFSRFKKKHFQF